MDIKSTVKTPFCITFWSVPQCSKPCYKNGLRHQQSHGVKGSIVQCSAPLPNTAENAHHQPAHAERLTADILQRRLLSRVEQSYAS